MGLHKRLQQLERENSEGELSSPFDIDISVVSQDEESRNTRGSKRRVGFFNNKRNHSGSGGLGGISFESRGGGGVSLASRASDLELGGIEEDDEDSDNAVGLDGSYRKGQFGSNRISGDSVASSVFSQLLPNRTVLFTFLVGTIGLISSTLFLGFGISSAVNEQKNVFRIRAGEFATEFRAVWDEYLYAGRWLHYGCTTQEINYDRFADLYEYITGTGLNVVVSLCFGDLRPLFI